MWSGQQPKGEDRQQPSSLGPWAAVYSSGQHPYVEVRQSGGSSVVVEVEVRMATVEDSTVRCALFLA